MSKIHFRVGRFVFAPKLMSTLITLLLLPFLVYLGFWQLGRSEEKERLVTILNSRSQSAPLSYLDPLLNTNVITKELQYRRLQITGEFINQYHFILDNQIVKKQVGYSIFTPFKLSKTNRFILINRGFIPIEGGRNIPPIIKAISGQITLNGLIHFPSNAFQLKTSAPEHLELALTNPDTAQIIRVQEINFDQVSELVGEIVYPFVVRLENDIAFGTSSTRHLGYAVQWFTMALVSLIYFLVINTRHEKTK